jgi:hypothetical protein
MSIRLYRKDYRERATKELLGILKDHPEGMSAKELRGTPLFHGGRTLSSRQVARLLRESNQVREYLGGQGMYTFTLYKLKTE